MSRIADRMATRRKEYESGERPVVSRGAERVLVLGAVIPLVAFVVLIIWGLLVR